ncbi:asparagine synthase-related protein [Jidongwangia harbinensis]|uniref:asparagine synthase-related protein n=1 Tax=Jidongwangia harbinensis TaxID=2878561 RepID=UPI001CD9FF4A|nr:asparagine synthase-related protein [Jidongwangia harbinensis]MCA2211684.1 hypothetical protein [Jidongwangia harbinensis]
MIVTGFGMSGWLAAGGPADGVVRRRHGAPGNAWDGSRRGGAGAERLAGEFVQGPAAAGGTPPRVLLTGWVDLDAPGSDPLAHLQDLVDANGPAAVRRLRGDFVLAHLARDGGLALYRGVSSLIPLFWRADEHALAWATDPMHLVAGSRPGLSDVDGSLLPMVVAEMGMPADRSWFGAVRRLPNGHRLTWEAGVGRPVLSRFDQFEPVSSMPATLPAAADALTDRLSRACGRLLSGDRRSVLLLSGGIDSAVVACEAGRRGAAMTGLHFTLESFPGFDEDREAAAAVAAAHGLSFVPYDLTKHVRHDGGYLDQATGRALPQTHVPQPGPWAAAEQAGSDQATFILSGLLSDQILADDQFRERFEVAGLSMLNPLVAGEPFWQTAKSLAGSTFAAPGGVGVLRYLRDRLVGRSTVALPGRDAMVRPLGFTAAAAERVAAGIQASVEAARGDLRDADRRRRRLPRGITPMFLVNEACNTPNLQAAWLNTYLPRRQLFATPFADRDVIEFALALPARYRTGFDYGVTVDKLALRIGYARQGMPEQVNQRMHQARIDAIPAVFVHQHVPVWRGLLGPESLLCELGVMDRDFARTLAPRLAYRNGEKIARLCAMELWLRRVAS